MRIKTILAAVVLVMATASAYADSKIYDMNYQSVDCDNNPVTLSAKIGLPTSTNTKIKFIVLHNHPTAGDNEQVPTGSEPMDQVTQLGLHINGLMNDIAGDGALIVSPDYLGFGVTKDRIHPYFAALHTARTCIDAELAAIEYAKSKGYTIDPNYYTLNAGYSQGGTVTLAIQRYLETMAPADVVKKINLKESYCGAGAYDLELTFEDWMSSSDIFYPGGAVWILQGMIEAYKDGCMRGIKLEDMLSESFNKSGMLAVLNAKNKKMGDVNDLIKKNVGNKDGKINAQELLSPAMFDKNSAIYKSLHKALAINNITTGWYPQHKIYLFHWKNDETVTYKNAELIKSLWPDMVVEMPTEYSHTPLLHEVFKKKGTNTMYLFIKDDATHIGYASRWYIFFYDGIMRDHK